MACDLETQTDPLKEKREKLFHLIQAVCESVVDDSVVKERLDYDTTGDAGLISNKKMAQTKFVKIKTRLFYKQKKFNLFREESEGYGKLLTELLSSEEPFDVDFMLQVIRSLIGCFNLDPNRVLDVIFECMEHRLHLESSFIPLIRKFLDNPETLNQIIAFKFGFYQEVATPESLYEATALAISHDLIDLDTLYPYLLPSDDLLEAHQKDELSDAQRVARRAAIISTSNEEKPREEKFNENEKFLLNENNQKLGLCAALLKIGNWGLASKIMSEKMPENYAISSPLVAKHVSNLIDAGIENIYKKYSGLHTVLSARINNPNIRSSRASAPPKSSIKDFLFKPVEDLVEFKERIVPMVSTIGPYIFRNPLLIVKLIRISKGMWSLEVKSSLEEEDESDLRPVILNMMDDSILPAMCLVNNNCGLSEELWQLFKLIPYEKRFRLYYGWKREPVKNPLLLKTRAATLKKIKYIMKRLSKENVKLSGRQLGKLSHSNPSYLIDNVSSQYHCPPNPSFVKIVTILIPIAATSTPGLS